MHLTNANAYIPYLCCIPGIFLLVLMVWFYRVINKDELKRLKEERKKNLHKNQTPSNAWNKLIMKISRGKDRGWEAQMLAQDLADEEFGKDFYDLSDDLQYKIYTIALHKIDSGKK